MKNGFITLILGVILISYPIQATENCEKILSQVEMEPTDELIAYLFELLDSSVITQDNLVHLEQGLANNQLINPINHQETQYGIFFASSKERASYYYYQNFLEAQKADSTFLNVDKLRIKLANYLSTLGIQRKQSQEIGSEIKNPFIKMRPIKIEAGHYKMGVPFIHFLFGAEALTQQKITFSTSFEVMSHPVSQYHWSLVMNEAPLHSIENGGKSNVLINGKMAAIQPDYPMTLSDPKDFYSFVKKINELSIQGSSILKEIIDGHHDGDAYDLISEAQLEYIMKQATTENGELFQTLVSTKQVEKISNYAWFDKNSSDSYHQLGELKPLFVNGEPIYDLFGNAWSVARSSFVDPITKKAPSEEFLAVRGGSARTGIKQFRATNRNGESMMRVLSHMGFRLVRVNSH